MKTLSLDLGTAKIGLCLFSENGVLLNSMTISYNDVVVNEKTGGKHTKCSDRRKNRSMRRQYDHERRRKIRLIAFLSKAGYIDGVTHEEMALWRKKQICPEHIIKMLSSKNPYAIRELLTFHKLNMSNEHNRLMFAQAMYSIIGKRGFAEKHGLMLDDNDEDVKESERGKIRKSISELEKKMGETGSKTVGEFMNHQIKSGERIRGEYHTSRKNQIIPEFKMICDMQGISEKMKKELFAIIFSEHKSVRKPHRAKCPFGKNAFVTYDSHPFFEEYRLWQFIRNIRVIDGEDNRVLTDEEVKKAIEFIVIHKNDFDFLELRNELGVEKCNFRDTQRVKVPKFTISLAKVLGKDISELGKYLSEVLGKSEDDALDEVWHRCFDAYRTDGEIGTYFSHHLNCDGVKLDDIEMSDETVNLSASALRKITPWMRDKGLGVSIACRMVNVRRVIKDHIRGGMAKEIIDAMEDRICQSVSHYSYDKDGPLDDFILEEMKKLALDTFPSKKELADKLWHLSLAEKYVAQKSNDGDKLLPVPHELFSNPHIDKSMAIVRRILNMLIKQHKINPDDTKVVLECGRMDSTIVGRIAQDMINKENEKNRKDAEKVLKEKLGCSKVGDEEKERYLLWKEQCGKSLWSGKEIKLENILSEDYEIDHTIARKRGGCNELYNKTLCESSINLKKTNIMPGLMNGIDKVRENVQSLFGPQIDELTEQYDKLSKKIKVSNNEEAKRNARIERIIVKYKLEYLKSKVNTFEAVVEPDGFCATHGHMTDLMVRCMRSWLKSVFRDVSFIRAKDVAEARNNWGLKKDRSTNTNHAQDAFVLCCLDYYGKTKNEPYEGFKDDLECVNSSMTHHVPCKSVKKLTKKKDGRGYGCALSGETQYAIRTDENGKKVTCVHISVNNENFEKNIKNIFNSDMRKRFEEAKDVTNVRDAKGKVVRHVLIKKNLKPENLIKFPRKNSISENENNNMIYYETNGNSCIGYYSNGKHVVLSIADEASGKRLERSIKDKKTSQEHQLKYIIRLGDTVILMKNNETEDDIRKLDTNDLKKRIYRLVGIESDKRIKFLRHDVPSTDNCETFYTNISEIDRTDVKGFRLSNAKLIKDSQIVTKIVFNDYH